MAARNTVQNVVPIRSRMTRWPSWRKAARGTGLPSPRGTVARIDGRNEVMTKRILEWLREEPLDSREAALRIGCSQKNVNYHLGKLRDRGQAVFDPDLRRWVPSRNGIIRKQAAREIELLIDELQPLVSRRLLDRLRGVRTLLRDHKHY